MNEAPAKEINWKALGRENQRYSLKIDKALINLLAFSLLIVLSFSVNSNAQSSSAKKLQISEWRKTLINSDVSEKRAEAAQLLAQSGDRKSAKVLINALIDKDDNVREQVILALGQLGAKSAVPAIINILKTSSEPRIKAASAFALGLIRDRRAVEPLIAALSTAENPVRMNIVVSLGRLGDPRAVEPLLAVPHDKNHESCAPISIALGQIKTGVSSVKLFNWLNSEDADICPNVAIAIVLIGGRNQVEPLLKILKNENPVSRRSAAYALGLLKDKRAVLQLIETLKDIDKQVRLNAVDALAEIKDKGAIEPLQILERTDSDQQVRDRAHEALIEIGAKKTH